MNDTAKPGPRLSELTLATERPSAHFLSSLYWMKTHTGRSYWSEHGLKTDKRFGVIVQGNYNGPVHFWVSGASYLCILFLSRTVNQHWMYLVRQWRNGNGSEVLWTPLRSVDKRRKLNNTKYPSMCKHLVCLLKRQVWDKFSIKLISSKGTKPPKQHLGI